MAMASALPTETTFTPPLPSHIIAVLEGAQLAYLATVEESKPHLSLMRFTLVHEEACGGAALVLTSRRDTRKFAALCATPDVAVLVHDDMAGALPDGQQLSVTLYGQAREVTGELAERLRARHLARNVGYETFIVGERIAVIAVTLSSARTCDLRDQAERAWAR